MSLRWRFASILATVALAVSVFACLAAYVSTASQLRSGIDETLKSRAAVVNTDSGRDGLRREGGRAGEIGPDGLADGDSDGGCPAAGSFQPAAGAQLVSVDGLVTPCIEGGPALPVLPSDSSLAPDVFAFRNVRIDQDHYRVLSVAWHDGGTLQIARDLDESDSLLERLALQLAALVALATGVAAVVGWAIATRLVRPIERLRDVTHRISATLDLSTPIDVDAKGEVGDLASSFTVMVAAVSRSQEQQRRLVSDASHEMRTPLTSLRSNLDLVNQIERLPVSERSEVIADIVEDVDELSALLGELVDLASDLATAEPNESLVLGDVARTVAARIQRRSGRTVSVDDRIGLEVLARPRQIERAISNLVDNAAKYSAADSPITVAIEGPTVTVQDRGRGIAAGDLDRIFDRFYRAVEVRTEPGSGLGLSIVDEIVRSHGGSVFARNRDGGGSEVGFTLPTPKLG